MRENTKNIITLIAVIAIIAWLAGIMSRRDPQGKHLKNLMPFARHKFSAFLNEAASIGYTVVIRDSVRTFEQQKAFHDKDKRNARPGHSDHETGNAIDADFHRGGKVLSKRTPRTTWLNTGLPALAEKYGISWGGNFKGYADNNHFYIRG